MTIDPRTPEGERKGMSRYCDMLEQRVKELEARLAEVAHAYDVTFKRRTELELAILPFVEFATNVDENGWTSTIHRESISTWFGPSDFRDIAKLKA